MIISKYKNNNGEYCISIVVSKGELTKTKNEKCFRITLSPNYLIHLDEKSKATINNVFNMDSLVDNTKK